MESRRRVKGRVAWRKPKGGKPKKEIGRLATQEDSGAWFLVLGSWVSEHQDRKLNERTTQADRQTSLIECLDTYIVHERQHVVRKQTVHLFQT